MLAVFHGFISFIVSLHIRCKLFVIHDSVQELGIFSDLNMLTNGAINISFEAFDKKDIYRVDMQLYPTLFHGMELFFFSQIAPCALPNTCR